MIICGIAISKGHKLATILSHQKDRGLDSVGFITKKTHYKAIRPDLKGYQKYLRSMAPKGELVLFHHRKASVGAINTDNAHPFEGERFLMMQNGTCLSFHSLFGNIFPADTDSESLLKYIEEQVDDIMDIPEALDNLATITGELFGTLIFTDMKHILLYCSGSRETFIDVVDNRVVEVTNYPEGKFMGYANQGWFIIDFDGEIIEDNFLELNKILFQKPDTTVYHNTTTGHSSYYNSHYDYYNPLDDPYGYEEQMRYGKKANDPYEDDLKDYYAQLAEQDLRDSQMEYKDLGTYWQEQYWEISSELQANASYYFNYYDHLCAYLFSAFGADNYQDFLENYDDAKVFFKLEVFNLAYNQTIGKLD